MATTQNKSWPGRLPGLFVLHILRVRGIKSFHLFYEVTISVTMSGLSGDTFILMLYLRLLEVSDFLRTVVNVPFVLRCLIIVVWLYWFVPA